MPLQPPTAQQLTHNGGPQTVVRRPMLLGNPLEELRKDGLIFFSLTLHPLIFTKAIQEYTNTTSQDTSDGDPRGFILLCIYEIKTHEEDKQVESK